MSAPECLLKIASAEDLREKPACSDPNDLANCSALEYSPPRDAHPVVWTDASIAAGLRGRGTGHEMVAQLFGHGALVNTNANGPENQDPEIDGLQALEAVAVPPMLLPRGDRLSAGGRCREVGSATPAFVQQSCM
jgi:hypothetical protein